MDFALKLKKSTILTNGTVLTLFVLFRDVEAVDFQAASTASASILQYKY